MSRVQKILYHEDLEMYEDDLGGWYKDIEDVVHRNAELFEDLSIEYLIQSWTQNPPKRINFISPLEWEYET